MKPIRKSLVVAIFFAINIFTFNLMAQVTTNTVTLGLDEIILLGTNTSTVNLTLTSTTAGVGVIQNATNSSARMLVSSIVSGTETRTITAQITGAGTVPAGTDLKLQALEPNLNFVGTKGTIGSEITLTTTPQVIVSGIGSCYSGIVDGDGYGLRYTWGVQSSSTTYADIRATGGATVTVTLTLTNNI